MKLFVISLCYIISLPMFLMADNTKVYFSQTGHYYQRIEIPPNTTWHQCRDSAIVLGGYMATATSLEENNFLANLAYPFETYLGGSDEVVESEWHWNTDEVWDFTAWRPGEPNNHWDDEDYIGLSSLDSQWNDMRNWFVDSQVFIVEYGYPVYSPIQNGDVNCDSAMNIFDITHMITYLYLNGPDPCEIPCPDINYNMAKVADTNYIFRNNPYPGLNIFALNFVFPDTGNLKIILTGNYGGGDTCCNTWALCIDTIYKDTFNIAGIYNDTLFTGCGMSYYGKAGIYGEIPVLPGNFNLYLNLCYENYYGCGQISLLDLALIAVYLPNDSENRKF